MHSEWISRCISIDSAHFSLLPKHGISFEVNFPDNNRSFGMTLSVIFPLHFMWSDVAMFPYSLCRSTVPFKLNLFTPFGFGISLKMAENPVKSTSQSTYGRMEHTFWLVDISCRIIGNVFFLQKHDYLKNKLK